MKGYSKYIYYKRNTFNVLVEFVHWFLHNFLLRSFAFLQFSSVQESFLDHREATIDFKGRREFVRAALLILYSERLYLDGNDSAPSMKRPVDAVSRGSNRHDCTESQVDGGDAPAAVANPSLPLTP